MKHKVFLTGVLAVLLTFGLILTGCSNPTGGDGGIPSTPVTEQAAFTALATDGSATANTTKLTLTFDKDIAGLSAGDITLTPNGTGAAKGSLSSTGSGVYDLTVGGIMVGGQITVSITKSGYGITPASKNVEVYTANQNTGIFTDVAMEAPSLSALNNNTAESPYTLVFSGIDLGQLSTITDAVAASGKYVNLDFAGCTATNAILSQISTAIRNNDHIKGISIPDGITSIENYAFYSGCENLTSITIPDSVVSIADYAFYLCTGLKSITISNGVMSIGEKAFYGCSSLQSITIPNCVE